MAYFQRLFFLALLAGVVGGVIASTLNIAINVPSIMEAEAFEHAAEHQTAADQAPHKHEQVSVLGRNLITFAAMVLAFVGYAFLVSVVAEVSGGLRTWGSGLFWGMGGFLAFNLVPAIGLPPELPGMPAADLGQRQLWWLCCACCTAGALLLAATVRKTAAYFASLVLLAAPFLYGAPTADGVATLVPEELQRHFVLGALAAGLVAWVAMGVTLGVLRSGDRCRTVLG
ncbi:CbtA family protein [Rhizobium grahamii]|uniref:Cobalt transporter subunit CbtA n=1 Tax=Rhizobium grahamii TaxID=1120045 RepID=A0A370KES0_9HYPH|nr:CbtA family protein [Rhizobium grahamii]RDJ02708.1 cobalt transporter subunit CbtA [Rhizobium grahamii]